MTTPWYYRNRFTNWLIARPWRWRYRTIYRSLRQTQEIRGHRYGGHGRLRAAWLALTFPHVHHDEEDQI